MNKKLELSTPGKDQDTLTMDRPNIYKYLDYRIYLKELFRYRKYKNKNFSFRYFSSKAGFKSTNILNLIMNGQRNLTNKSLAKVAKGFDLAKKERDFFENLVFMNQAKTDEEKAYYYNKIATTTGYTKVKKLEKAIHDYYSNWYNLAVREIIIFGTRNYTAKQIADLLNPAVSTSQVKKSLKLLTELGMIKKNKEGFWEKREKAVTTGPEIHSFMVANFHRKMLKLASDSIARHPSGKRDITALTISINSDTIKEIKERISAFRREILEMACNETNTNQVLQINLQAFPLTHKDTGGR